MLSMAIQGKQSESEQTVAPDGYDGGRDIIKYKIDRGNVSAFRICHMKPSASRPGASQIHVCSGMKRGELEV